MATFSERMKKLRKEKGLTLEDLSKLTGITTTTLSRYETGKRIPNATALEELAKAFGVSVDYLLGKTDIRYSADRIEKIISDDPDMIVFWQELQEKDELKMLFKQVKDLTDDDIRVILSIIRRFKKEISEQG